MFQKFGVGVVVYVCPRVLAVNPVNERFNRLGDFLKAKYRGGGPMVGNQGVRVSLLQVMGEDSKAIW